MRTIRHYVDQRAAEPPATWLIAPETGAIMTYAQLQRESRDLGRHLLGLGLHKGDKVALMLHNSYQTARLLIGVMYSGFMVAPLNLLAQPSQLAYVLEHSDSRAVFTSAEYAGRVNAALAGIGRDIKVITINPDALEIFDRASLPDVALPEISEADDALLMYTSGTTGKPKGCVLSNRSVVAGGEYTSAAHELTAKDRVLCAMPLYHINGQIVTTVAPLVHGGSVVMPHRFSVSNYWELVTRHRCTWINVVPTMINYLLQAPHPCDRGHDISHVKFCRSASAPLPPELHRAFEEKFHIGIIETFGMTETNAPCFTNPYDRSKRKIGSPGTAFGNEAKVIDPATGKEQPRGTPGELMVRGDNVMTGYYKDPESTAMTLEPDGWMHTGDLGYMDDDGFVFVTGRSKELIIKGGENIAPREIDEALMKHPAVLEAAAVGIPDADYGQDIMACVVLKPGTDCTAEALAAFSQQELGKFKTPKTIKFVSELPKGPSGKVQRLKLLDT
ncbi:MAG: AMP-binding protein [Betaproteobacteria bacterium]|jgi:acyl-CoA synthetase (AMP-forming)/AMP-acid ligase II|nr:AMP-binding protein [Betaproteobacteria bacterium]MDH4292699.1 AMP-binding protein [Betaproteobacteria bacterium]MDH5342001.1 AMP-binding protein [Betaproteobacteria bacterium]